MTVYFIEKSPPPFFSREVFIKVFFCLTGEKKRLSGKQIKFRVISIHKDEKFCFLMSNYNFPNPDLKKSFTFITIRVSLLLSSERKG